MSVFARAVSGFTFFQLPAEHPKTVIALLAIVCITCFRDTEIAAPMISIHNLKQLYLDPQ